MAEGSASNPEGHSPRYWKSHPNAPKPVASSETKKEPTKTVREQRQRGHEYLLAAVGLLAEFCAVALGEEWLGWGAVIFLGLAFYEYTKSFLAKRNRWWQLGACAIVLAVLGTGMWYATGVMERHIRARYMTAPSLQISMDPHKLLTLDNTQGTAALTDFKVDALEYYLDPSALVNHKQVSIVSRNAIGGDLDFKHFDIKAGEVKRIDLKQDRYGYLLAYLRKPPELEIADVQFHYVCMRFVFTQEDTGETWVHYIIVSPYDDGLAWGENPDRVGDNQQGGSNGFPYSIARTMKADARSFYGTEYREYKP